MKRIIGFALALALVLSLCACKQKPRDDSVLPDAAPAQQGEDNSGDVQNQNATIQTDKVTDENVGQDKTDTSNKNDKTETSTANEAESTADEAVVSGTEPFEETYLPVLEGYAKRITEDGKSKFHTDLNSFLIKFDITKEIIDEVMALPELKYDVGNEPFEVDYTLESEEKSLPEGAVIVRGCFAPEYGTTMCLYENIGPVNGIANFDIKKAFTLCNFKIEKVYTDTDKIAVGDTIQLARWNAICQKPTGGYTTYYSGFENFADKTEQERTFVLAFVYNKEFDCNKVTTLFQNAYEQVKNNTGDCKQQLAYDILQKYK